MSLDLNSGRVEEFLRSDGREFQTEGARKLKERSPNVLVLRFGTFRSFSHDESEKDNLVESCQKSGRQKWLSCTVVGISSEASAVLAGVVSRDRIWTF